MLTPSFPAIPGQQVIINAIASSVAPISSLVVMFNGQPLTLNANGQATVTAGAPGQTLITATATDQDGLVGTATAYLQGARPERHDAAGRLLRQLGALRRAVEPHRDSGHGCRQQPRTRGPWRSPRPTTRRSPCWQPATRAVNDGPLAQLNPADMANGFYQLRLTATDLSGRTATTTAQIEIHTATKPGDLVVTDSDLSVVLDGTTVLIERTYDPLNRDGSGDFGAGWSLVNRQTNLQTNVATTGQEAYGVFNPFSDGTEVYLTLPTGQRVRFTFAPTSFEVAGQTFYQPAWQADSGVTYTLESTECRAHEVGQQLLRPDDRPAVQPRQSVLQRAELHAGGPGQHAIPARRQTETSSARSPPRALSFISATAASRRPMGRRSSSCGTARG